MVDPCWNVAVPVGVPPEPVTVAVKVTDCPYREGLGEELKVVLVATVPVASAAVTLLGAVRSRC